MIRQLTDSAFLASVTPLRRADGTGLRRRKFTTWVYSFAFNHLLRTRKRRAEREDLTFARFEEEIHTGLSDATFHISEGIDQALLVERVRKLVDSGNYRLF